jgi:hypothetical protein
VDILKSSTEPLYHTELNPTEPAVISLLYYDSITIKRRETKIVLEIETQDPYSMFLFAVFILRTCFSLSTSILFMSEE